MPPCSRGYLGPPPTLTVAGRVNVLSVDADTVSLRRSALGLDGRRRDMASSKAAWGRHHLGGITLVQQVLASSSDSGGAAVGGVLFVIFCVVSFCIYWIPTVVAAVRHVPNTGSVVVVNLFLGWTFIGWVVALAMAMRSQNA